ncbi:inactive protein RESTRICTED TEV MOVEMENT 2-like [Abrus precatorius]|uniref:Inactive protein RESTRICTED TEV MOVEMENT 2-like n=1 Tax=Abrus precatorius TaxID=3816 RepID=A0A8B8MIJ3_ABRPR|nr:inactive protein RESTRICTED TEV MOVEMENT 2-like [Abrus precatorius]
MAQSAVNRVYEDFDPFFEWSEDEASVTLVVMLPGFTKEQLRVQVTSTPVLRINGERRIIENTWRRFAKEFSIPSHCDNNEVSAKYERGILTIKFPKLISPVKPLPQEATNTPQKETPMPQRPNAEALAHDHVDKQGSPQKAKEPTSDEKEKGKTEESSQKEKEPISDEKEKNKKTEVAEEVRTNGVSATTQFTTTKAQEKPKAKITQRLKTRVLDFTVSLRSGADEDVKQGSGGKLTKLKKPKTWMNIVVVILLVMVVGLYVKNALRPSQGGSIFEEF